MKMRAINKKIQGCRRCRLHETRENILLGEGDPEARVMLVAQAPGEKEDEEGSMFIGPSGEVLDDLLKDAGVRRDEIYMTNLIKCMLPDYRKPKQDEIDACSDYLDEEIRSVDPEILVPLGYYATRYLFRKHSLPFDEDLAEVTGELYFSEMKIYPLAHPASLLYDDSFENEMRKNYRKLKVFLAPCKWYPVCPMKRFYEAGKLDKRWVELYCKGDWESCVRFQKEEEGEYHPDHMLPDGQKEKDLEG